MGTGTTLLSLGRNDHLSVVCKCTLPVCFFLAERTKEKKVILFIIYIFRSQNHKGD